MRSVTVTVFGCIFFLFLSQAVALRCRTGNQHINDQFQKILQVCRRRNMGNSDDDSGYDNNSSDGSFDTNEEIFDKKFFIGNNNRYSTTQSSNDYKYRKTDRSSRTDNNQYNQYNYTNGNSRDSYGYDHSNNNQGSYSSYQGRTRQGRIDTNNGNYNYEREQACVIQCFFNELNVVDQRGFPERQAVTNLMTQNIQDPELQDFIEESVMECFHFLNSDSRKEKCDFSQNLISCLAEKGKERCEDWEN